MCQVYARLHPEPTARALKLSQMPGTSTELSPPLVPRGCGRAWNGSSILLLSRAGAGCLALSWLGADVLAGLCVPRAGARVEQEKDFLDDSSLKQIPVSKCRFHSSQQRTAPIQPDSNRKKAIMKHIDGEVTFLRRAYSRFAIFVS